MGQTVDNYGDTKTEVLNAVNVNGKSTKEDADEDDVLLKKDVSRAGENINNFSCYMQVFFRLIFTQLFINLNNQMPFKASK